MKQPDRINILLVEDDQLIAMSEISDLTDEGFYVVHAKSGEKAVELINEPEAEFNLILMDINLGSGMNGGDAAKKILTMHDIPIVFLSSHTEKEIIQSTEEITSYGYVLKHSGNAVLTAAIKMALRLFEANKKIHESEKKFQKAFNYNPIPMSINDMLDNGAFVDCNEAFLELTGYDKTELIGKNPLDLDFYANPDDRTKIIELFARDGFVKKYRYMYKKRNGETLMKYISMSRISIDDKPYLLVFQSD
ncbi:MAG: response regulator [Spirochaetes bacterium]|nr:response regulator [Spirochaetota bacterium]